MRVIVNDLSFQYKFFSEKEALNKFIEFIQVCHEIESHRLKNVDKLIVVDNIDVNFDIAPNCKIIKLLQRVLPREERTYLLSILLNRETVENLPEYKFVFDGKESFACAAAREEAVVSLLSSTVFYNCSLDGKIGNKKVSIINIGNKRHIFIHRKFLGKRIYRPNSEKHKKQRWNSYGKGKVGSPMDLNDEQAQDLLDRAIEYKGRLYGRCNGINYSFQNEQDVYYHGYIDNELGDDIISKLDDYNWE